MQELKPIKEEKYAKFMTTGTALLWLPLTVSAVLT